MGIETGAPPGSETSEIADFRLTPEGGYFTLHLKNGFPPGQAQPLALLAQIALTQMHRAVAQHSTDLTYLAGDVVKSPNGKAIVLAGGAMTGQTWLARHLLAGGGEAWSSGFAALTVKGELLPYPTPGVPKESLEVGALLNLTYEPGATWTVQEMTPGEATTHLLPLLASRGQGMGIALPRLAALAAQARLRWRGVRGQADEAITRLKHTGAWI